MDCIAHRVTWTQLSDFAKVGVFHNPFKLIKVIAHFLPILENYEWKWRLYSTNIIRSFWDRNATFLAFS